MTEEVGKRKRNRTSRYNDDFLDNEERRMIQQALKVSKRDVQRVAVTIPDAPTYYPSAEEFLDPIEYVKKIKKEAEHFGICKIVPPPDWNMRSEINFFNPKLFKTKLQPVDKLQQGQGFDDGRQYTIQGYKDMADQFYNNWVQKHYNNCTPAHEQLAKDYWDMVETSQKEAEVEYGNDIDTADFGSGFALDNLKQEQDHDSGKTRSKYYRWNLNNLPRDEKSLLKYVSLPINGINVPWMYMGMLFATFCWHNEDNYLYSINYSHFGATKQWYGVPGELASEFERTSKDFLLGLFREMPDLMHHMTTQISPSLLSKNFIPVYRASQEQGTFIITFPKAFHCGFSYGFNIGEAVNFAPFDWLPFGGEAEERYRMFAREPVFSHIRLLFTLLNNQDVFTAKEQQILNSLAVKFLDLEIDWRKSFEMAGYRFRVAPPNDFRVINKKTIDYDDKRCCAICKQVCVFTAVACGCDNVRVVCPYHYTKLCKCGKEKKFVISWADNKLLGNLKSDVQKKI